jgi:hypothetical protein
MFSLPKELLLQICCHLRSLNLILTPTHLNLAKAVTLLPDALPVGLAIRRIAC